MGLDTDSCGGEERKLPFRYKRIAEKKIGSICCHLSCTIEEYYYFSC